MPNMTRRRGLISSALRPLVPYLAPASRSLAPSTNKLITSLGSSRCTQPRFILDFCSNQGRENVQEWYKSQGRDTRFARLEYRKHKEGRVKHEFIVVWLNRTTLCRFDRRARDGSRGYVLREEGAPAEDSAHVLSSFEAEYKELMEQSEILLTVKLPRGEDLGIVLAVCEGIQTHSKASAYSLMQYNCYFFSWMIVAAVARRTYNWTTSILSQEGWDNILRSSFPHMDPTPIRREGKPLPTLPQRTRARRWLSRIVSKVYVRLKRNGNLLTSNSCVEICSDTGAFQDLLLSEYSKAHGIIEKIVSKLLLRSQLGPTLTKELSRIEMAALLSTRRTIAENKVLGKCFQLEHSLVRPFLRLACNGYALEQLRIASYITSEILSGKEGPWGQSTNALWEAVWRNAWNAYHSESGVYLTDSHLNPMLVMYSMEQVKWDELPSRTMTEWKTAWDECDRLATQYTTTLTTAVLPMTLELLNDMAPDLLVFGDSYLHCGYTKSSKSQPSLQDFIRRRMQDHFEFVDSLGFGSCHELITTVEEAMCEIWITSLDIIDSSRYLL